MSRHGDLHVVLAVRQSHDRERDRQGIPVETECSGGIASVDDYSSCYGGNRWKRLQRIDATVGREDGDPAKKEPALLRHRRCFPARIIAAITFVAAIILCPLLLDTDYVNIVG